MTTFLLWGAIVEAAHAYQQTSASNVYTIITGSGARSDFPENLPASSNPIEHEFSRFTDQGVHGRAFAVSEALHTGRVGVEAEAHIVPNNPVMTLTSKTDVYAMFGDTTRFSTIPYFVNSQDYVVGMRYGVLLEGGFRSSSPTLPNLRGSITVGLEVAGFTSFAFAQYLNSGTSSSGFSLNPPTGSVFDDALLTLDIPVSPELRQSKSVDFSFEITASATASNRPYLYPSPGITMTTDARNTLTFSMLQFVLSNGEVVTPESLGVDVTFDSGIVSPNVPEPSSLALLIAALLGLIPRTSKAVTAWASRTPMKGEKITPGVRPRSHE